MMDKLFRNVIYRQAMLRIFQEAKALVDFDLIDKKQHKAVHVSPGQVIDITIEVYEKPEEEPFKGIGGMDFMIYDEATNMEDEG